jgi:hypothetical protein
MSASPLAGCIEYIPEHYLRHISFPRTGEMERQFVAKNIIEATPSIKMLTFTTRP